jgi:lipid A 4'-phosphatase
MAVAQFYESGSGSRLAQYLSAGALAVFIVSAPASLLIPFIDVEVARFFYGPDNAFARNDPAVEIIRNFFKAVYIAACVGALAGFVSCYFGRGCWFGLTAVQNLFVITCLALGPGVVSNLVLKDNWGRARPSQIVQFGGERTFSAALVPSQQCKKNCSFVSGEASSIFMVFFAAAFVFPLWARRLVLLGVAGGGAAGLIRMAQGGHFLSDVVFAGIAMALTAAFAYQLFCMMGYRELIVRHPAAHDA